MEIFGWSLMTRETVITDTPAQSWGTWKNDLLEKDSKHMESQGNVGSGSWLSFSTRMDQQVMMKVGISFVSEEQAKRNATEEISGTERPPGIWVTKRAA